MVGIMAHSTLAITISYHPCIDSWTPLCIPLCHSIHGDHSCNVERYVGLCTEQFYAIIPTLFPCFLQICYPYILLHFLES